MCSAGGLEVGNGYVYYLQTNEWIQWMVRAEPSPASAISFSSCDRFQLKPVTHQCRLIRDWLIYTWINSQLLTHPLIREFAKQIGMNDEIERTQCCADIRSADPPQGSYRHSSGSVSIRAVESAESCRQDGAASVVRAMVMVAAGQVSFWGHGQGHHCCCHPRT